MASANTENYPRGWHYVFTGQDYAKSSISLSSDLPRQCGLWSGLEVTSGNRRKTGIDFRRSTLGSGVSILEINERSPNLALVIRIIADALSRQSLRFLSLRVSFQVKGEIAGFAFLNTSLR